MKKLIPLLLTALMLTGCASAPAETTTPPTTTIPEPTLPPIEYTATADMLAGCILNPGNLTRLQNKIRQAQSGAPTVLAYIGGSITEGLDVLPRECYVTVSGHEFAQRYGTGSNVTWVNAGLSGTPSNLGVLRLQRDVLSHTPDIVFIEFAVNDSQDMQEKRCFESMIRTILAQPNEPAVVLIFNRTQEGYTCQSVMGMTGVFYSLPMVSVTNAITAELDAGRMTWREYSNDGVHPNPNGHRLTADFLAYLFDLANKAQCEGYTLPTADQYGAPYRNAVMITPEDDTSMIEAIGSFRQVRGGRTGFPTGWKYTEGSDPFTFTVTGNAVFLIYNRNKTANMGSVDVYVNGEKSMTINAKDPDGWGDPFSKMVASSKEPQTWTVELRPTEETEDKLFELYAFAYTPGDE